MQGTIFTKTNETRVEKILEILALLEKSAASNKASTEDMQKLLDPVTRVLEAPAKVAVPRNEPLGLTIKKLAEEAPLKDLTYALAIYLNRIDEHLS